MFGQSSYNDPLRPMDNITGVVINDNDFARLEYLQRGGSVSLEEAKITALKNNREVVKSIEALFSNDDFANFVSDIQKRIQVCEMYVFNPEITSDAKAVWFGELTSLRAIMNLFNSYRHNNSIAYEQLIAIEVDAVASMDSVEGDE